MSDDLPTVLVLSVISHINIFGILIVKDVLQQLLIGRLLLYVLIVDQLQKTCTCVQTDLDLTKSTALDELLKPSRVISLLIPDLRKPLNSLNDHA